MFPLHKIHWKIPLADPQAVDPWDFFRAFSAWIGKSEASIQPGLKAPLDDILIDVADYRHVQGGTKIILVGHDADYVLDEADGVTGLVYACKMPLAGDDAERFAFALGKALASADRLEQSAVLAGKLKFDRSRLVFIANDRAAVPNTRENFDVLTPALKAALARCFTEVKFRLDYLSADPKQRLRVMASRHV